MSSVVFFEWLRGPRTQEDLSFQQIFFPEAAVTPFGSVAARIAGEIYGAVRRPRSRALDITIAACAIEQDAALWTLNVEDFEDIPGLTLYRG